MYFKFTIRLLLRFVFVNKYFIRVLLVSFSYFVIKIVPFVYLEPSELCHLGEIFFFNNHRSFKTTPTNQMLAIGCSP